MQTKKISTWWNKMVYFCTGVKRRRDDGYLLQGWTQSGLSRFTLFSTSVACAYNRRMTECLLSSFQVKNSLLNLLLICLKLTQVGEGKKHFMSRIQECYNQIIYSLFEITLASR